MQLKFALAPLSDWKIDHSVPSSRRARLCGNTSFNDIVAKIQSESRIERIRSEEGREAKRGLRRYVVWLAATAYAIDLWHNSRGGYRAQYYINPKLGGAVNCYALDLLGAHAGDLIQNDSHRERYWPLASKSICHPQTRLWIHQGRWLRNAKPADRLLHVSGWRHQDHYECKKMLKLLTWGALMPADEFRLVLKGQWLDKNGSAIDKPPKATRALEIHRWGFS